MCQIFGPLYIYITMLLVYVSTNGTVNKDFYGNAIRLRWCTCHWVSARCDHRQDDDIVPCACSGRVHAWRPSGEDRAMNGKLTCRCRRFHAHSPRIPCSHLSPLVAYTCSGPAASQPAGDVAVTCCSSWSDTNCHSTRSMHLTPSLPTIISVHISCISYFWLRVCNRWRCQLYVSLSVNLLIISYVYLLGE